MAERSGVLEGEGLTPRLPALVAVFSFSLAELAQGSTSVPGLEHQIMLLLTAPLTYHSFRLTSFVLLSLSSRFI